MKRLGIAVLLLASGVALLLAWGPRPRFIREGLVLPVTARVAADGPDPDRFCGSTALHDVLLLRAFEMALKPGEPYRRKEDFTARCRREGPAVRLAVHDRAGRQVVSVSEPMGSVYGTAFRLAERLADDPAVIKAAIDLYRRNADYSAREGADQFARRAWRESAGNLFFGLEGGADPAVLYYGLYADHARLGHPNQAVWYLLCYLRASGREPEALTDEQLRPLAELASIETAAKALFPNVPAITLAFRQLAAYRRGNVNEMYQNARRMTEEAPWSVRAYDALARVQEQAGWSALAAAWRARRDLAVRVNADGPGLAARLFKRLGRLQRAPAARNSSSGLAPSFSRDSSHTRRSA